MLRSPRLQLSSAALLALTILSTACGASVSATRDDAATGTDGSDVAASQDVTPPTPVECDVGQWCWQWPRPQGNPLNAVYVVSAREAWAVGDRGTIVRFDGERWYQVRSPTAHDLHVMWGSGPADVWAIGSPATNNGNSPYSLLRWDGTQWRTINHGALPFIRDLHGSGADNLWLVTAGNDSSAALLRWTGTTFAAAPALPDNARAQSVCTRSANEVWVTAADARSTWPSLLYRWDGNAWTLVHRTDLPRGERLNTGVVCPANGTAIVGHFDFESGVETYLEFRDGRLGGDTLPLPARTAPQLLRTPHGAVYYVTANEAVEWTPGGWQRRFALPGISALSVHFDHLPDRSAGFLVQGTPFVATLRDAQWITDPTSVRDALSVVIAGDPAQNSDPIAAFGGATWARPVGDRWTHNTTPIIANGMPFAVRSAWGASINRLWLVGEAGAIALYDARTQSITPATVATPVSEALLAVDGAGSAAWAVGENGAVLRLDGERWVPPSVELPREVDGLRLTSLTLTDVDVISDNDVMIIGNDPLGGRFGTIYFRWNGTRWSAALAFGATASIFDRDPRGNAYVISENQLEKRPAGGGAPTILARLSDSVARLRVYGEDEIELVLSNEAGLRLVTWDSDRRELRDRTPIVAGVARNIVPGAPDAQNRATYWAVGAAGAVLRYVAPN